MMCFMGAKETRLWNVTRLLLKNRLHVGHLGISKNSVKTLLKPFGHRYCETDALSGQGVDAKHHSAWFSSQWYV